MADAWYYVDNDAQAGPVSFEQLRNFLLSPSGGKHALVWRKGLQDWKAAGETPELVAIFEGPPPIPRRLVPTPPLVTNAEPVGGPIPRLTDPAVAPPRKLSAGKKALRIALHIAASIFVAGIGAFVLMVFGELLWLLLPVALIGIAWFILAKCKIETPAIPMVAVLLGHTGWMVVGLASLYFMGRLRGDQFWLLIDVVVVACLAIWFFVARSRGSVIGILVYQICGLVLGIIQMGNVSLPGISSQSIVVAQGMHIILRIAGIGLCIYALLEMGKKTRTVERSW
jgi:hypothetical protein